MKPNAISIMQAIMIALIASAPAHGQGYSVGWSSFPDGYALSTSGNRVAHSSAGEPFVERTESPPVVLQSGFLAYPGSWSTSLLVKASVRFFLEGPYNSGTLLMNKALRTGGFLATHFGSIPVPTEAVDSINIELRNATSASASTIRKFRPAWLLTDGSIRDFFDTTANYVTFDTLAGNYYLVISHRNHIAIMTSASQALNGAEPALPYDFTTAQSQAYGSNPMKAVAGGRFAMTAGDANTNGQVATSDINTIIRPRLGQSGYQNADINLNGQIQTSDINTYARPNLGKGTQVPTSPVQGGTTKEETR